MPRSMSPEFAHRVRVYWEDTDAAGIVYYANYLRFFERARTEWLRRAGWGQQALRDGHGVVFVVTEASVRYLAPARVDDELDITVELAEAPRASVVLRQAARCGARTLAEGRIMLACVDAGTLRPRRIPTTVLEAIA